MFAEPSSEAFRLEIFNQNAHPRSRTHPHFANTGVFAPCFLLQSIVFSNQSPLQTLFWFWGVCSRSPFRPQTIVFSNQSLLKSMFFIWGWVRDVFPVSVFWFWVVTYKESVGYRCHLLHVDVMVVIILHLEVIILTSSLQPSHTLMLLISKMFYLFPSPQACYIMLSSLQQLFNHPIPFMRKRESPAQPQDNKRSRSTITSFHRHQLNMNQSQDHTSSYLNVCHVNTANKIWQATDFNDGIILTIRWPITCLNMHAWASIPLLMSKWQWTMVGWTYVLPCIQTKRISVQLLQQCVTHSSHPTGVLAGNLQEAGFKIYLTARKMAPVARMITHEVWMWNMALCFGKG